MKIFHENTTEQDVRNVIENALESFSLVINDIRIVNDKIKVYLHSGHFIDSDSARYYSNEISFMTGYETDYQVIDRDHDFYIIFQKKYFKDVFSKEHFEEFECPRCGTIHYDAYDADTCC